MTSFDSLLAADLAGVFLQEHKETVLYRINGAGGGNAIDAVVFRTEVDGISFDGSKGAHSQIDILVRNDADPTLGVDVPNLKKDTVVFEQSHEGPDRFYRVVRILNGDAGGWLLRCDGAGTPP